MKEYILENLSDNMQGSSYIGLFFFSCIAFTIILFLFTRARIQYFNDIDKRILGTKDPFWSNIHGLTIFILLLIVSSDFFFVAWDSMAIMCLGSNVGGVKCGPRNFQSIILLDNRIDTEYAMFYLGSLLMPLIWTSWAFLQELKISKKMRSARTDLLLGNIDGAPTREPMPPVVVQVPAPRQSDEPATFEEVLQAMEAELEKAMDAAKQLKQELDETKEKVETLEVEVQEKDIEIQQIKESKTNFDKMISEKSEEKDSETKSLSLTDSVMVGDSVMGGVKIDKQINNDPEAIARAVINAYKMGASDSE